MIGLYRAAFALGLGVLVVGIAAGSYRSVVAERRLPPLVFQNMTEIEGLLAERRYDEAIERLEMTLELVPGQRRLTHNVLGNALAAEGRQAEAIAQYRLSLALDPSFAEAHNNLGVALARTGALDEGLDEWMRAVELEPGYQDAWRNLAKAVSSAGSRPGAENAQTLERARALLASSGRAVATAPEPAEARPAEADSAEALDSPAVVVARRSVEQFFAFELAALHGSFTSELARKMSVGDLRNLRARVVSELGNEVELLRERVEPRGPAQAYLRVSRFDRFDGLVELGVLVEPDGSVAYFGLRTGDVQAPAGR
jgi:tetratricopeptide (TPR) repeat protein